jgi:hypothetical protein
VVVEEVGGMVVVCVCVCVCVCGGGTNQGFGLYLESWIEGIASCEGCSKSYPLTQHAHSP